MPPPSVTARPHTAHRLNDRFRNLRQELLAIEYFCKGTILERWMKCGQSGCACHRDVSKRHGPYWEWTYKAQGRTVNVRLSSQAGPLYKAASQQYRKLKSLLSRLEKLSRTALAASAKKAEPDSKL